MIRTKDVDYLFSSLLVRVHVTELREAFSGANITQTRHKQRSLLRPPLRVVAGRRERQKDKGVCWLVEAVYPRMAERQTTGDIWSTRVQRELLAITTDNGDDAATTDARSMLPEYCTVKAHTLDIAKGTCVVIVQVDLAGASSVVFEVNASLPMGADGSIDATQAAYPNAPPVPRLTAGSAVFPAGSTIQVGHRIPMDLDWTPSLRLTDVILHIGLKIKESVLQGEPFFSEKEPDLLSEAVDEVAQDLAKGARFFASKIGEKATSFSKALSSTSPSFRSRGLARQATPTSQASISKVKIGDEINLLEEPWVDAHGVYSCKAIRRPQFVKAMLADVEHKKEPAAIGGATTSMLRSFAKSARSVMEESFLMITETHIIEIRANKLNMQNGTVTFCVPISQMAKLKFRRQESVSLFFKTAPNDPLVYMCPDCGDVVHQIQTVLKRKGVRGKHTNASAYKAINEAMQIIQEIQAKETAIDHDPTVERVNEIMDLYRQAAEKFEVAGDIRHEEVLTHMKMFLAKPSTMSVLDGSFKKPAASPEKFVPEGEVLERNADVLGDFDEEKPKTKDDSSHSEDREFEQNIDTLLKDAKEDFGQYKLDDDDDETAETSTPTPTSADDDLADMAADLDAMMKEADKELAELMSS